MPPASTPDWNTQAAEEKLAKLWSSYASGLGRLGIVLPTGSAERFRTEVLDPFRQNSNSSGKWGRIRAVAAWSEWRPDLLPRSDYPTPEKLARLRDGLNELLAKLDGSKTSSRWFGSKSENPATEPSTRAFLKQCRDTFDMLTRPAPPGVGDTFADLRTISNEIESLLAAAPPNWSAGAALRAREFLELASNGEQEPNPLAEIAARLTAYTRHPDSEPADLSLAIVEAFTNTLQNLGPIGKLSRERALWLDRVLECLRGWGSGFNIEFLPREWSFVNPPQAMALAGGGTEVAAVYRPDDPIGVVIRVKTIGFSSGAKVLRAAAVSVSAGPAPPGLGDLEALVKDIDHPAAESIRVRLRDWRNASLYGTLESSAVELFVEFWDRLRLEIDNVSPGVSTNFSDHLAVLLDSVFGLTLFYPANFQDRPGGWVQTIDGARMTTGRVREVTRPGLVDRNGELRVPARVIVE